MSVLQPFGAWRTAGRKITQAGIAAIRDSLEAGYIPVLHGDCVLDSEQHCSILSGDTIIEVRGMGAAPRQSGVWCNLIFALLVVTSWFCPGDPVYQQESFYLPLLELLLA